MSPADRRQLFELGAASVVAADLYRKRSRSGPDALTLQELAGEVTEHAAAITTEPHESLAPRVYGTWLATEDHLTACTRPRALTRLTTVAGYSAYMLGRLAFNMGRPVEALRFATLAADHSGELDDPVLAGSVAGLSSTLAYYGGRYQDALAEAEAGRVRSGGHPYVSARLAAYEARAYAALGDEQRARDALARMVGTAADVPAVPGASPFGPAAASMFQSVVFLRVGAGDEAEPVARSAVEAFDRGRASGTEEHGHAVLALAAALVARRVPVPDEAATLAARAVAMLDGWPTSSVEAMVGRVAGNLRPFGAVPEVRDFYELVAARPRLALTSGAS